MSDKMHADEITLVDIIAVILRFRRMILIVTAAAVILSLVVVLILPGLSYNKAVEDDFFEGVMTCRPSNGISIFTDEDEAVKFALQTLLNPAIILEALKTSGLDNLNGINLKTDDKSRQISAVRQSFLNSANFKITEKDRVINVFVKMKDELIVKVFLENLMILSNQSLQKVLLSEAEAEISSFENILDIEYPRAVIEQNLLKTFRSYDAALGFITGEVPGLINVQLPYVYISTVNKSALRNSLIKKSIVFVIVSLILIVFTAFILQWIDNLRHDSESMKKIHSALKRERI